MNKLYSVVFDNDPDFPGQLQFCNVASDEEYWTGGGTNITQNLEYATEVANMCKFNYPEVNYRVVEVALKEMV